MTRLEKKRKKGRRIGTAMRGDMQRAYDQRGNALAHLFNLYSLKGKKDFVPPTELAFLHLLHCESDPEVAKVNYEVVKSSPCDKGLSFHYVEVITCRGVLQLRQVRSAVSAETAKLTAAREALVESYKSSGRIALGAYTTTEFLVFTEQQIIPGNEVRLRNWNRLLFRYSQTRYHSLFHAKQLFLAHLTHVGVCEVRGILALETEDVAACLLLSAAIECVSHGTCGSDLFDSHFSMNTRFYLRGRK